MFKVYGKPGCANCLKAKNLLDAKGLEYEYIDIFQNPEALDFIVQQDFRSVPQVYKGEEHVGGFEELQSTLEG